MYTPLEGPDGFLLERNGNLTMWKSKPSRFPYSLVESLLPLSMMNVRLRFVNSHLGWIYLFEIIQELLVIKNNQIIIVSIA